MCSCETNEPDCVVVKHIFHHLPPIGCPKQDIIMHKAEQVAVRATNSFIIGLKDVVRIVRIVNNVQLEITAYRFGDILSQLA